MAVKTKERQGSQEEEKACNYLIKHGYKIKQRNFWTRWGEIDIIAQDNQEWVLIEVKARKRQGLVKPEEAVDWHKRKRLKLAARIYAAQFKEERNYRFDLLLLEKGRECVVYRHIKNVFFMNE